jgi:hypothetical protein
MVKRCKKVRRHKKARRCKEEVIIYLSSNALFPLDDEHIYHVMFACKYVLQTCKLQANLYNKTCRKLASLKNKLSKIHTCSLGMLVPP